MSEGIKGQAGQKIIFSPPPPFITELLALDVFIIIMMPVIVMQNKA